MGAGNRAMWACTIALVMRYKYPLMHIHGDPNSCLKPGEAGKRWLQSDCLKIHCALFQPTSFKQANSASCNMHHEGLLVVLFRPAVAEGMSTSGHICQISHDDAPCNFAGCACLRLIQATNRPRSSRGLPGGPAAVAAVTAVTAAGQQWKSPAASGLLQLRVQAPCQTCECNSVQAHAIQCRQRPDEVGGVGWVEERGSKGRLGVWKKEDLEEEVGFGVGVISRSAVCGPPHLPSQSGVDLVLVMPHRQLVILRHSTQHMQNLRGSMQPSHT